MKKGLIVIIINLSLFNLSVQGKLFKSIDRVRDSKELRTKNLNQVTLQDSSIYIYYNSFPKQNDSITTKWIYDYNDKQEITRKASFSFDTINRQWIPVEKTEYFYDENLHDSVEIHYNSKSEIDYKITYIYNTDNLLSSKTRTFRYRSTWRFNKEMHYYDQIGNDTCVIFYSSSCCDSNIVYPEHKEIYTYDIKRNVLSHISQRYKQNRWVNESKMQYAYDINNKDTLYMSFKWDEIAGDWSEEYKMVTFYNASTGNDTSKYSYSNWDKNDNVWKTISRSVNLYDSSGKLTSSVVYNWFSDQWNDDLKTEYSYDLLGNLVSKILYYHNPDGWCKSNMSVLNYDNDGNQISEISYRWSDNWLFWTKTYNYFHKTESRIDNQGEISSVTIPGEMQLNPSKTDPVIYWNNPDKISTGTLLSELQLNATSNVPGVFRYDPPVNTMLKIGNNQELKVTFYPNDSVFYNKVSQSAFIDVVANQEIDGILDNYKIKLRPNPSHTLIYLEYCGDEPIIIKLTDIAGKILLSKKIANKDIIDVSGLPHGLYFLYTETGKRAQTQRVMID